ncbi:MAG TPA: hypothetical protein VLH81_11420 [Desulfobacterales bacterium]|nr:hypothetical protein [Desulfobacterales bacterium]
MTTPNTRARIARIMALVIIGVALLAAGVSPVVVTLWVLLLVVPVLAALRLVLNLLDGAAQDTPARIGRIIALAITGVALLAAGVSSVMTAWSSLFARFMHLEDLGLTHVAEITRITAADRGLLVSGGILALLGAAALIAAAVLARRPRPASR